jgi:phosphate transport system permease protein
MNNIHSQKHSDGAVRPRGEAFVWATGMGLTIALLMIVFLVGLILRNGLDVFWPKRVALITLREEGQTRFKGGTRMAGVVVLEKERDRRDLTESQLRDPDPRARREKQLFIGNRDVYGESFAFIGVGDIAELQFPRDIIMAERLEWGNAIFWPIELRLPDGSTIAAEDGSFQAAFDRLITEARERQTLINQIERNQIGRINSEMRNLELEERFFLQQPALSPGQQAAFERVRRRIAELREQYEPLATRAGQLRKQQSESVLRYRLATGEERAAPIGTFVHYYYPNALGVMQRSQLFLKNIWNFVTDYPREANTEGGIFPALFGTVVMTLLMSVAVTPFGVLAAIYLREYARQGPFVRGVRIAVNNLAGVPSIVFGIFGLGFFVYLVGGTIDQIFYPRALASTTPTFGTGGVLWASLTLALMTVPVVIVATEEALAAVSRGVRDGSLACGASKWQTIQRLVLPASAPGILTGLILAMARGAGEVAPLILVGVVALAPNLPLDGNFPFMHLERKFMHLGFHIYDLGFQSPDSEAARPMVFATTLVLVLLVIVLNLAAVIIRNRLRKRYASAQF